VPRVLGAERAQPFLRGDALQAGEGARVAPPAVDLHVHGAADGVLRLARPGDHRARARAPLRVERVLAGLRARSLDDAHVVAELVAHARRDAGEARLQLGIEPRRLARGDGGRGGCGRTGRRDAAAATSAAGTHAPRGPPSGAPGASGAASVRRP
jgi:hypothetical protein